MVDVLAIAGDWTNYSALSVDPRWNKYFDATGLKKGQLSNFAADRNVSVLSFYSNLSFIPYFTDLSGNNLFIETVINNDFAKTGLFCSFNMDLFETAYPNGLVELVGNSIDSTNSIDFLSYKDTIVENVEFKNTYLDRAGNVFGININGSDRNTNTNGRNFMFAEGYVNNVTLSSTPYVSSSYTTSSIVSGPTTGTYKLGTYTTVSNNLTFTINVTASLTFTQSGNTYSASTASVYTSISVTGTGLTQNGIDGTLLYIPSSAIGGTATTTGLSASHNTPIDVSPFNSSLPGHLTGFKLTVYDSTNTVVSDNTVTYTGSSVDSTIAAYIESAWVSISTISGWSISATNSTYLSITSNIKGSVYNSYSYKVTFYNYLGQPSTSNLLPFSGGSDATGIPNATPLIIRIGYLSSLTIGYKAGTSSYAVSNGSVISGLTNSSVIITPSDLASGTYYTTYVLNSGGINALTSAAPGLLPSVQESDIVLGAGSYNVFGNNITSLTYSNITVDT